MLYTKHIIAAFTSLAEHGDRALRFKGSLHCLPRDQWHPMTDAGSDPFSSGSGIAQYMANYEGSGTGFNSGLMQITTHASYHEIDSPHPHTAHSSV